MPTLKGVDYLRDKLRFKKNRVKLRYKYYEMKQMVRDLNISTPPDLRYWMGSLGWCSRAVDSLADRLVFREFENDNFGMNEIFNLNNRDILIDSAILGALITSCDFIYITADDDGYPRMRVIDGSHATGIIDPITNMLIEGYAVIDFDEHDNALTEAYFIPGHTIIYQNGRIMNDVPNSAPYPLLVPIINRPDAKRPE